MTTETADAVEGATAPGSAEPLEGIRVVDFCWVLAGPLGTRILANFGADVIRVESLARPDNMRVRPAPAGVQSLDHGYWFNDVNTGKRSVSLDLGTEEGRRIALDLIAEADVVTNNYRPGVLDRIGLGYEVARERNPGVVYLHMPGCGAQGPWAQRATMGGLLTAAAGFNVQMGFPGRPPRGLGVALPDFSSPYLLASSVLAALDDRATTGEGREITLNQLSSAISFLGVDWLAYTSSGIPPVPRRNRHPDYCPHGVYPASGDDRWIAIAVEGDEEWASLCTLIGRAELASDERFASHEARKAREDEVDAIVGVWTAGLDAWEAADVVQARGIAAAAVEDLRDMLTRDPHLSRHYQRVTQPGPPEIELTIDGEAIHLDGADQRLSRAPIFGEHTESVLKELLGLSDDEYVQLLVDEVIR